MQRMFSYALILHLCLLVASAVFGDVEVPVKFKSTDMLDLGNFHGAKPANENAGWQFWGAREPIVTPDWVVFPVKGVYRFIVESKSDQFEPEDTKKGIFAEFDIRFHILGEKNNAGEIKKLAKTKADTDGDQTFAHGSAKADNNAGDDWYLAEVSTMDPITKEPIEIKGGTKAQLEIWFTNDKWEAPKDRNLWVRSFEVLLPKGVRLSVQPAGKLATTWGAMKFQ